MSLFTRLCFKIALRRLLEKTHHFPESSKLRMSHNCIIKNMVETSHLTFLFFQLAFGLKSEHKQYMLE